MAITVENARAMQAASMMTKGPRRDWRRRMREVGSVGAIERTIVLVSNPPGWAAEWPLETALHCIPRLRGVDRFLAGQRFLRRPTVGALTDRERRLVLDWLMDQRERVVGCRS